MDGFEKPKSEKERAVELKGIYDSALKGPNGLEVWSRAAELKRELEEKHPNADDFLLFHILSGSVLFEDHDPKGFDLPGGEIEKFIRNLQK